MRKGTVIAMVIILVGAFSMMIAMQVVLKKKGLGQPANTVSVADILEGDVAQGRVTVTGIVDEVDPAAGAIYLRDLEKDEVCRDGICFRPVIRVVADGDFEVGKLARVTGTIGYSGGLPYLVAGGAE